MYSIINKIVFAKKYLEFSYNNKYVIVNAEINTSIKLSEEEFFVFKELMNKKQQSVDSLVEYVNKNPEAHKLIVRMIAAKVVLMNNGKIRTIYDDEPDYHAVYWGLTEVCNFRCIYCYAECGPENKICEGTVLSLNECYRVVDEIVGMGFDILSFTGGEPLLNSNVFKIAKYAKGRGIKCGILTNGSLITEENVKKFKVFDYVKISLDSDRAEINDITRGTGAYKKIIRGLNLLKENDIKILIGSVVTKYNKDNVNDLLEFVDTNYNVVSHSVTNYIPAGRGKENDIGCSFEEIDAINNNIFFEKRKKLKDNVNIITQDVFYSEGRKTSCGMAMGEIFINYKADVYPCRMTYSDEYFMGNILEIGLKQALSNFDDKRKEFHVDNLQCRDCDYKYLCGGGCRMYHAGYSGSIKKNSPEVCKQYKNQIEKLVLVKHGIC